MVVPQGYQVRQQQQGPSCWSKVKLGFMMGCMVGGSVGVIIGTVATIRFGFNFIPVNLHFLTKIHNKVHFLSIHFLLDIT